MAMKLEDITNRIVASSATLIALVAMATAVYQSKLTRDQAKAAVWPYLFVGNSINAGYERIVQNVGLGPAVVKAFEVRVNGAVVHSWNEVAESLHVHPTWTGRKSTSFGPGFVVPVNTVITLLQLPDSSDARMFRLHRNEITTRLCYCSLYGDCWTVGEGSFEPKAVGSCKEDPSRVFEP